MSIVKSISVGNGDMFYIKHDSDNFTIIDCNLRADDKIVIINELINESKGKNITRFISTSPDYDHIRGLKELDKKMGIQNFYVVKNNALKNSSNEDFQKYCELRDSSKAFIISQGVSRKWMNLGDSERGSSGINILWPITTNKHFIKALEDAEKGISPNNISPIFRYALNNSASVLWMGDLEKPFMDLYEARAWVEKFVYCYNHEHHQSGIRYVTPVERHDGRDREILAQRHEVYQHAKHRNPERWSGSTRNWQPIDKVSLNPIGGRSQMMKYKIKEAA